MSAKFNERFARQIVKETMRVGRGESVFIQAVREALDLAEAIALECDITGAKPLITTYSDEYMNKALTQPDERLVEATPRHMLEAVSASDVLISIGRPALGRTPASKVGAWRRSRKPINDRMDEKGIRWVAIAYPTHERSRESGVSVERFRSVILSALDVYYKDLARRGKVLQHALSGSKEVHATSPQGTDLRFNVDQRKWIVDDGILSEEDIAAKDVGMNLPCGEIFVAPIEDSANGKAVFDVPTSYYGHHVRGLKLEFRNGRVVDYDAESGRNEFESILNSATGDRDRIAEFAIGLNPKARFVNDILVDEKVLGTVHIAIGDNKGPAYGGRNTSSIHWDLIMTKPTVRVDGKTLMKEGKLVV